MKVTTSKNSHLFFNSEKQNREIRDAVFGMAPVLCNQMSIQLSQVLVTEVQKHLLPMVAAKLDSLKAQLQADVAQKISITDVVIKENIANICKSKVSFMIITY